MKLIPELANELGHALGATQTNPDGSTGTFFDHVKNCVRQIEQIEHDDNITGADKKAMVIHNLKVLGIELAGIVGDTIIQMACLVVKAELSTLVL
jgi:soluble P-type ATPase